MVTFESITTKDYKFLYEILLERDPIVNISHNKIPTFNEHCKFWDSNGNKYYKESKIVYDKNKKIGYYYITTRNEIGIFIKKKYQNMGYGKSILFIVCMKHKDVEIIANINPKNKISQNMFKKIGFKLIQYTYKLNSN